MKNIFLTGNYTTDVDDDVYEIVGKWNWFALPSRMMVYAATGHNSFKLHHYIIGHPITGLVVDHIDNDGLNNQRSNLRFVTNRQNCSKRQVNKGVLPGIGYQANGYLAQIRIKSKLKYLGRRKDPFEAFSLYRTALHDIGEELLPEHEELWRSHNVTYRTNEGIGTKTARTKNY
jgi:hypothetical protein